MKWALADTTFRSQDHLYMDKAHLEAAADPLGITYEDLATLASQRVGDLVNAASPELGWAKASGVKFISWTGTADRNIHPRNSIEYYRRVAEYFGTKVDDPALQSWFRLFLYPGVGHCGSGEGAQPGDSHNGPLFRALVNWVENGVQPDQIIATKYSGTTGAPSGALGPVPNHLTGAVVATRPVCPYPKTAVYKGSGSVNEAENFTCGGNLETVEIVNQDRIAKHKLENGTGLVAPPYGARH
jgi:feruloyl esterase